MTKRAQVCINYKSGRQVVFTCTNFKVSMSGGELWKVTWENAEPNPMHIGVSDIESVWEM